MGWGPGAWVPGFLPCTHRGAGQTGPRTRTIHARPGAKQHASQGANKDHAREVTTEHPLGNRKEPNHGGQKHARRGGTGSGRVKNRQLALAAGPGFGAHIEMADFCDYFDVNGGVGACVCVRGSQLAPPPDQEGWRGAMRYGRGAS